MTEHDVTMIPDDKYAHLMQPQCLCGWSFSGFVNGRLAEHFGQQHRDEVAA